MIIPLIVLPVIAIKPDFAFRLSRKWDFRQNASSTIIRMFPSGIS